ncbi:MAG: hypothetical protein LBD31_02335 [Treponema sp.]|jgi:hypothetical protein|nr:hypothetical protein [Treponema sp.]
MKRDYLNLTDHDFNNFFNNLMAYMEEKCGGPSPEWTHIPAAARQELAEILPRWRDSFEKTRIAHLPVETSLKNKAKQDAKALLRPFVNIYLREDQPAVTGADRVAMGIPNRDTIPTYHPVPAVRPETHAYPVGQGTHRVTVSNPQTGSFRRPSLVRGVAFAYRIRDLQDPKASPFDMPSVFQTKTVRDFHWSEADYGRVCDYAAAYENERGDRGPWSKVMSVIIA